MPIYSEYKLGTKTFLDWIIKSAEAINPISRRLPHTALNIITRVDLIVNVDINLPCLYEESYLPSLETVLFVAYKAIKLRRLTNQLHLDASKRDNLPNESDKTHAYFVKILEEVHSKLKNWYNKKFADISSQQGYEDSVKISESFTNRFEALSEEALDDFANVPEDLFMDPSIISSSANIVCDDSTFDFDVDTVDSDVDKVKTLVLCFMIDLVELKKKVRAAWKGVAKDEVHVVVAVSITVAAIQVVDRLYVEMQLFLPSVEDVATLLINICGEYLSLSRIGDGPLSKMYSELMMLFSILNKFSVAVLSKYEITGGKLAECHLPEDRDRFIEQYGELSMTAKSLEEFFFVELCLLHRMIYLFNATFEDAFKPFPSSRLFLQSFRTYFSNKTVSVALLVRCLMWTQIISVLQDKDDLILGRTIYITRKYCRRTIQLLSPYEEVLRYRALLPPRQDYTNPTQEDTLDIEEWYKIWHHNPLLQGMHLLDFIIQNDGGFSTGILLNGCELLSLFKALKHEGLLPTDNHIPIMDLLSSLTENQDAKTASESVCRGNYLTNSTKQMTRKLEICNEYFGNLPNRIKRRGLRHVKVYASGRRIHCQSGLLYSYLFEQDLSKLVDWVSLSSSDIVDTIGSMAFSQLFETRTLSLMTVKLARIFNSVFFELANAIPELFTEAVEFSRKKYGSGIFQDPIKISQVSITYQACFTTRLLSTLDKIDQLSTQQRSIFLDQVRRVVSVTTSYLKGVDIERELYVFSVDERGVMMKEFGSTPPLNILDKEFMAGPFFQFIAQDSAAQMSTLHQMLEDYSQSTSKKSNSDEKQRDVLIATLKEYIKEKPACLQITNGKNHKFPTIFDYAVCVLKNMDFAEWLVQMRGFLPRGIKFQRIDFGRTRNVPTDKNCLDQTHLGFACQYQVKWAVGFILAVSQGIDRSFVGSDRDNTALHYIMYMGIPQYLYDYVLYGNFIENLENKAGKRVFDIIVNDEMRAVKAQFILKECSEESFNTTTQNALRQSAVKVDSLIERTRTKSSAVNAKVVKEASQAGKVVTREEEDKAEKAAEELLRMLDLEEEKEANKVGNGNVKTSKGSVTKKSDGSSSTNTSASTTTTGKKKKKK